MRSRASTTLMTSLCVTLLFITWLHCADGLKCYLCQQCNDPYRPEEDKFYLDRRRNFFGLREDKFFQCSDASLCYKRIPKEDEDTGVYLHRFPISRGCRYEETHTGCREEFDYYWGFAINVCVCDTDFCNHGNKMAPSFISITVALMLIYVMD